MRFVPLKETRLTVLAERADADESGDWNQIIFLRYIGQNDHPFVRLSAHRIAICGFDDVDVIALHDGYWDGDNWVDLPYAVDFEINPSEWEEIFYNEETETEILKAIPINDSHFPAEYGGMKS